MTKIFKENDGPETAQNGKFEVENYWIPQERGIIQLEMKKNNSDSSVLGEPIVKLVYWDRNKGELRIDCQEIVILDQNKCLFNFEKYEKFKGKNATFQDLFTIM